MRALATIAATLMLLADLGAATPEWQQIHPWPAAEDFAGLAFGNGRWVAAGAATVTSDDGVVWRVVPGLRDLEAVVWFNGRFVGVSSLGRVATSPDGREWSWNQEALWSSPLLRWDMAASGSRLVAVARIESELYDQFEGRVFTSDDTVSWQRVETPVDSLFTAVAWGNGRFVAVGKLPDVILVSEDGVTWQEAILPGDGGSFAEPLDVEWCGDHFIAIGRPGHATSQDGFSWISVPPPFSGPFADGLRCNGEDVAYFGHDASDGWLEVRTSAGESSSFTVADRVPRDAVYRSGRWTAAGESGSLLAARHEGGSTRLDSGALEGVAGTAAGGDQLVAVGRSPGLGERIWASSDGVSWQEVHAKPFPPQGLFFVTWTGERFIAGGHGHANGGSGLLVSDDGRTWRPPNGDLPEDALYFIDGAGEGSHAVVLAAIANPYRHVAMVTEDGESWQEVVLDVPGAPSALAWTGSSYVAAGWPGFVVTSPDGYDWNTAALGDAVNWHDVAVGDGVTVVVGSGGMVARSRDLVDWQLGTTDVRSSLMEVEWDGERFVARSSSFLDPADQLRWSVDGETWEALAGTEFHAIVDLLPRDGAMLAFTRQSRIFRSPPDDSLGPDRHRWIVPVAVDAPGDGSVGWHSDIRLLNPNGGFNRTWIAGSPQGSTVPESLQLQLPPMGQMLQPGLLDGLFAQHVGAQPLEIASEDPMVGWSRVFTAGARGSFGQRVPVIGEEELVSGSETVVLPMMAGGVGFRSNVGVSNLGHADIAVEVRVHAGDGAMLGTLVMEVGAGEWTQYNRVLEQLGAAGADTAWAEISCPSPDARYYAYASLVDELSGDPILVSATRPTAEALLVPAVAHNPGVGGTLWRSDLALVNPGSAVASLRVELLDGNDSAAVELPLEPRSSRVLTDVVAQLFGATGSAALRLVPESGEVAAASRLFTVSAAGSFGQLVPAVVEAASIPADGEAWLVGLEQSQSARSNIGLVNTSDRTVEVELEYVHGDGIPIAVIRTTVPPRTLVQDNEPLARVCVQPVQGYVVIRPSSSGLHAWASVIDQCSGDPVFVPASSAGD